MPPLLLSPAIVRVVRHTDLTTCLGHIPALPQQNRQFTKFLNNLFGLESRTWHHLPPVFEPNPVLTTLELVAVMKGSSSKSGVVYDRSLILRRLCQNQTHDDWFETVYAVRNRKKMSEIIYFLGSSSLSIPVSWKVYLSRRPMSSFRSEKPVTSVSEETGSSLERNCNRPSS